MKSTTTLLLILSLSWLSESKHNHHHGRSYIYYEEKELHRTKRNIDSEPKKLTPRIEVSPIKHAERNKRSLYRPYVPGQVQDVRIQIKLKTYWKDQLANRYTPQFRLLAGNVIDEISNALIDNRNFVEAAVLKFRPSKWNILVDVSLKFFKTEVDPLHYLEGIVASGWVSGLQVFSNYFKVIKIINGNVNFPVWNYPKGLRLRLHPAILTKVRPKKTKQKVVLPTNYKEIKISYQLYQRWNVFFLVKFSAPYRLLSGNIEESLDHAFMTSPNYLDSQVLGFRESQEGQCIVDMIVRFSSEEVYPAQKLKILVSSGNIGNVPVISDSLEIYEINNITSDQPIQEPVSQEEFPKPHSDADVNQGNETETEKGKGNPAYIKKISGQQPENKQPIYPPARKQASNVTEKGSNVTGKTPSAYASMYLKLQRLRLLKQNSVMVMAHQSRIKPKTSKENVLEETSQPVYPKQSKIDNNGVVISEYHQQQKEFQPQQQETSNYQQTQQLQQQQPTQYQGGEKQTLRYQQQQENVPQYPQQQPIPYQQQKTPQQEQQKLQSQQQYSSLSNDAAQHDRELWQSLPEQVEGKLVMNSQKPLLQATHQQETPKGYEKQLAQAPAKTTTDYELEKLQQQIKNQNENKGANNVETGAQGQEDGLAYSSDTPTLTKTLYPQIAYSNNQTKGYNPYNGTETTNKGNPKIQNSILQVAENVLKETQSNGTNVANTSITEPEANSQNQDRNGVVTLIAGVLNEQVKHIKAVQMQTIYTYPIANSNTSTNYVENETNKNKEPKQEQGESGTEGPQQNSSTYIQEQGNKSHPQNVFSSNSFSAQQASTGELPYGVYTEKTPENNTKGNETQFTVASQKAKPPSSIGTAYWNLSAAQPIEPYPVGKSPWLNQQPVQPKAVNAYWDAQQTTKPQQLSTQQKQQQQQQLSTAQQQPLITYPQQAQQQQPVTQQQQPVTQQQLQQNLNIDQQQQQQQNTQQPTTYQQQQQQQNMQQPTTYKQQQSSAYQQQQQQQQNTQQPTTYQQQQQQQNMQQPTTYKQQQSSAYQQQQQQQQQQQNAQQPTTYQQQQQPATYQQQRQEKTQQPFTYQQEKQVSAPSSEGKVSQTLAPAYEPSPVTGHETKQEPQLAMSSSSSKPEAVTSPYPFYNKEKSIFPNSNYIAQTNAPPLTSLTSITSAANQIISQSSTKENKTSVMGYYNPNEQSANRTEPIGYTVTTQSPPQNETKPKVEGAPLTPHIYTPKIKIYLWPPPVSPSENHPSQNNTLESVVSTEKEVSSDAIYHSLHGVMTLKQTWYPLLSNNGSLPFKVLAQHIEHSVEETYLAHHMRVTCKVKGLKKSHRNASSDAAPDKVGVDFDLTFQSSETEVIQTLKQVSKNGVMSELLVFPDSVSVENISAPNTLAPSSPEQANQTTSSSSEQTVVATSPVPLGNTAEVKPENNTKIVNYSTAFQSTVSPSEILMSTKPPSPSFEFVTAPKDMPKSCEEIRNFGVGKSDGQYVLEARQGCHLSVICQNMEDTHPKEFLGGPNRQQWEAYPYAALIKISPHDKENIQSRACLENSDEGRKLLEEIFQAKGKQQAPTPPWQSNIKKLLEGRKRREIRNKFIVISEQDAGRISSSRVSRSSDSEGADWGVL